MPGTIQILSLILRLGSEIWIYHEKKKKTEPFNFLDIAIINITIDIENEQVPLENMHVRPYNCHIKKTDISYIKTANGLAKISIDKPTNKKIFISHD